MSCVSVIFYQRLSHCARVCSLIHVCMMQCLEVAEYISRCVQSAAGLQLLYPPPPLAHLKWQFVKHGPLLALYLSSQPFPARLLLSLICPLPLLFASLVLLPSLTFPSLLPPPLISIPPVHSASSLSACLSPSVLLFPSVSLICRSSSCGFSFSLSLPVFSQSF